MLGRRDLSGDGFLLDWVLVGLLEVFGEVVVNVMTYVVV
jgi:hypothetical protein